MVPPIIPNANASYFVNPRCDDESDACEEVDQEEDDDAGAAA